MFVVLQYDLTYDAPTVVNGEVYLDFEDAEAAAEEQQLLSPSAHSNLFKVGKVNLDRLVAA